MIIIHSILSQLFLVILPFLLILQASGISTGNSLLNTGFPSSAETERFSFVQTDCPFDLPTGVVKGEDIICGSVAVPENHSEPDGPSIQLSVAVIKASSSFPQPDPLLMAQGGPGGSTIETYASRLLANNDFITDRDIVLFDQRGTKYSSPNLYCEEFDQLVAETLEQELSDEEEKELTIQALTKCHDRLTTEEQVNFSAFNSFENADDIEAIRKALGYEKINLYGVSYGTLLALHFMERYPESLRSVILDAVVPRQTNFILNSPRTMDRSFSMLFEACKEDPDCSKYYPNLENEFYTLVNSLNDQPARIRLTDRDASKTYPHAVIDGEAFMNGLFQMMYAGSIIPALPRMIHEAKNGDYNFFSRIYSLLVFDRSMSLGMYYSVICAEDSDFVPSDQDLSGVRLEIADLGKDDPEDLLKICQLWNVDTLGESADFPVQSQIPALLLSGSFDPITPPAYAEETAKTLANSYDIVFPAGGHGQALEGECENQIIRSFLQNPAVRPQTGCIENQLKPDFISPANTIDFPPGLDLLNLERTAAIQFLTLGISLFFLLSAVPGIPLIGLIAAYQRRRAASQIPTPQMQISFSSAEPYQPVEINPPAGKPIAPKGSFFSRIAGWLAFIAGPILTVFIIGMTIVLFRMALENDNRVFFGVTSAAKPLFFFPPVFGAITIGMIIASIQSWVRSYWSGWTRIYFGLLTLSAIVCCIILLIWGVFNSLL